MKKTREDIAALFTRTPRKGAFEPHTYLEMAGTVGHDALELIVDVLLEHDSLHPLFATSSSAVADICECVTFATTHGPRRVRVDARIRRVYAEIEPDVMEAVHCLSGTIPARGWADMLDIVPLDSMSPQEIAHWLSPTKAMIQDAMATPAWQALTQSRIERYGWDPQRIKSVTDQMAWYATPHIEYH